MLFFKPMDIKQRWEIAEAAWKQFVDRGDCKEMIDALRARNYTQAIDQMRFVWLVGYDAALANVETSGARFSNN
jgi:hypothetical protein